jgi:uncharacterized protein YggE
VKARCAAGLEKAFACAALAALCAGAAAADAPEPPALVVSGEGESAAAPDIAEIVAGVVTQAPTAEAALAANSKAMRAVLDALAKAKVARADVQTQGLSVQPVRRPWPQQGEPPPAGPEIVGYEVANSVRAVVRDLDALGAVLDALVRAGANRLDGVSFALADATAPADEARRRAVADARRRASLYANAAGVALGRVLRIEEGGAPVFEPRMARFATAAESVPTAPGTLAFHAAVRVTFALEPR